MVFSSHVFLYYFLPGVLLLYYACPTPWRSGLLALSSFVFYGWWRPDFSLLMLFSAVLDFGAGARIDAAQQRGERGTRWLLLSLVANLGLLAYFKYANFGVATMNTLLAEFGWKEVQWTRVVLPVGISFYTFQTLSYTIDVWRRQVTRSRHFVDFLSYVTLFPQLVAGPIVRYSSLADQLHRREHSASKFLQGVLVFQTGLCKKLLIADVLGQLADEAFKAEGLGMSAAWLGILGYAFQIYFDFSGYSDMAIGLGLMLGFRFPINFDQPYRSVSITDFWRRWHVSLSTWLRDYLYVPLGGNRKGPVRTYVNLALTMLLGGLWHGANWTFIAWGAYQGFWLIMERLMGKRSLYARSPVAVRMALTFGLALVGWVFFRAASITEALEYLRAMFFGLDGTKALTLRPIHVVALVAAVGITWWMPTTQTLASRMSPWYVATMQPLFLLALVQLHFSNNVPFLYYQF